MATETQLVMEDCSLMSRRALSTCPADWGYGDTSPYNTLLQKGLDKPATPRLHKMASEGTTFTNFHTLGAECSPSRASWMARLPPVAPRPRLSRLSRAVHNARSCPADGALALRQAREDPPRDRQPRHQRGQGAPAGPCPPPPHPS